MNWRIIVKCSVVHHIRPHAEGHSLGICPEKDDHHHPLPHHHHHHHQDGEGSIKNDDRTSQGQGWRAVQYGGRLQRVIIISCKLFIIGLLSNKLVYHWFFFGLSLVYH